MLRNILHGFIFDIFHPQHNTRAYRFYESIKLLAAKDLATDGL